MSGECPECGGAVLWGGQGWVPHSDGFHTVQRRLLIKAARQQFQRLAELKAWTEWCAREQFVGIRWRNGVYHGWQSEERWELPYEWWDSTIRQGDREVVLRSIREHINAQFEAVHDVTINQATWFHKIYDDRLARLGDDDPRPICGSEPPRIIVEPDGSEWAAGDCWCTIAPGHGGLCYCGPCSARYGAPGWVMQG
jgi:hypothetical protein